MISMHKEGEWLVGQLSENEAGIPLGDLLRDQWRLPRKIVHLLFQNKELIVDGTPATQHQKAVTNQSIALRVCLPEPYGVEPVQKELAIIYEDDHLLVVNKPAGLLVHPTESHHNDSLDHLVAGHFQKNRLQAKVRHIHRLDQDTSGAIMYAKHALAASLLDETLREQQIKRTYIAVVHGIVEQKTGTIKASIGRDRHHPTRRRVVPNGDLAITHYQVLEQFQKASKVECRLETGKTHQIRVHMSYIGHPLLGDLLYGGKAVGINRQALHAASLFFKHPFGGNSVKVEAMWPDDLQTLVNRNF